MDFLLCEHNGRAEVTSDSEHDNNLGTLERSEAFHYYYSSKLRFSKPPAAPPSTQLHLPLGWHCH